MKNLKRSFLLCLLLITSSYAQAQVYEVSYSSSPYEALADADLVNENNMVMAAGVPLYLNIPIGFEFVFHGETFTELSISENGYAIFSDGGAIVSFISFYDSNLKDFQDDPVQSPIYYLTEGEVGNRIFKCEMVMFGFAEDQENDDYANAQLWLYENCNEFEIRIGDSSIDPSEDNLFWLGNASPYFAYGQYSEGVYYILAGDPQDPYQQNNLMNALDALPESGTVYTYTNCVSSVNEQAFDSITCFPNPVINVLNVTLTEPSEIIVLAMDGTMVASSRTNLETATLDVSKLSPGMFVLQVISDEGIHSTRFLKL